MRNTTPENEKATAPVPAVGAAGEQSNNKLTNDTITEKPESAIFDIVFRVFCIRKDRDMDED